MRFVHLGSLRGKLKSKVITEAFASRERNFNDFFVPPGHSHRMRKSKGGVLIMLMLSYNLFEVLCIPYI